MAFEQKDMSGSLFRNNRKEKDTHPDYSGTVRIDGHDMWVSGWLREQKDGTKYFSLAFKYKDGTADRPEAKAQEFKEAVKQRFPDAEFSDDVPFAPEWR